MSTTNNHHQWIAAADPENVGGTTYFYHSHQAIPVVDDGHNGVGSGAVDPLLEDPSQTGAHIYPNYSIFSGQPPPNMKDHSNSSVVITPGAAAAGGATGAGSEPAARVTTLGSPSKNQTLNHSPSPTSFFAPDGMKVELLQRSAMLLSQPNLSLFPDLPQQIDHFHDICPLENFPLNAAPKSTSFVGYPTSVYKAVNSKNGFTYCLRRIHGFRLPSGKWLSLIESWKKLNHCNLVQLREIFTTKAFGDNSLIFVYDYFPTAETLIARHFIRNQNGHTNGYVDPFSAGDPSVPRPYSHQRNSLLKHQANLLPESLLWAYIIQLSSIIRIIHAEGLAVRTLDPTKVLVTSKTRPSIRLNCCGILDVITFDNNANLATLTPFYQQEDLVALGKLILALSCNSILAVQRENLQTSMELINRTYSLDLRNLILFLVNPRANQTRSINDIMPMIGARFYKELDSANDRADVLEHYLAREIENGRLFRLLVKMNTIIERQEMNQDPQWSETGDRYLLKLFRDYIFHQITADGRPWVDMSHVVYTLNRLDAGTMEKVCLMSRDEQNVLITSYAELKQCIEQSFAEILNSTAAAAAAALTSSPSHQGTMPVQNSMGTASASLRSVLMNSTANS